MIGEVGPKFAGIMLSQTEIPDGPGDFLPVAGGCLGENRFYSRARMVQPAGNFVVRQFQRLRAGDGAPESDREPWAAALHDRKLALEIAAQGARLGPPPAVPVWP